MTIHENCLYLTEQTGRHLPQLPIDIFLRSLAEDKGKRGIAIILSGTGSDGTLGIKAVKEADGMVMVQDEDSAKFDGMPRSSIATGLVDYILPPGKMPEELLKYIQHPYVTKPSHYKNVLENEGDNLSKIIYIIKDQIGVDFSYYKPNTIIRRLEKRMSINQITLLEDYLAFLLNSPNEVQILYKELLIGVTQFFRDPEAYETIKNKIIPDLVARTNNADALRIWCVGCSTGEEAYSMAILVSEHLEKMRTTREVKIFATDIDQSSIEYAGAGIYPESIASDVSPEFLMKYFKEKEKGFQINERIRRMVIFANHNITKDPPFTKIDLISCRNLLIYLNHDTQKRVNSMFYYSLNTNSYLLLGSSESIGELINGFKPMDTKWKIFQTKPGYQPPHTTNLFTVPSKGVAPAKKNWEDSGLAKKETLKIDSLFSNLLDQFMPPAI